MRGGRVDSGRKTKGRGGCLDEEVLPVDLLRWLYRKSIVHGAAAVAVASGYYQPSAEAAKPLETATVE